MSIGTVAVYGLFNLTPKLRSPLKRSKINTPMCIKPTRAEKLGKLRSRQLVNLIFKKCDIIYINVLLLQFTFSGTLKIFPPKKT